MKGVINILDGSGHTEVVFDTADPELVAAVEKVFADAKARKSLIVAGTGDNATRVNTLEDMLSAEEVTVIPQIVGG